MKYRNKSAFGLIPLVKGDPDNLDGRVITYATVEGIPTDYITASYSCISPLDFMDKFGEERLLTISMFYPSHIVINK